MTRHDDLLLVGSVPLDTAEEVLATFGGALGSDLPALPDGEVGLRRHWISRLHFQVLALHPDIAIEQRPALDNGVERLNPRNTGESWRFRVRPGVERIRFGEPGWRLGYARDAVNSYFVFRTLREQGRLPAHLRFQVSLASVHSAVPPRIFPEPRDTAIVREGYAVALADEVRAIVSHIPARDLAIQWDCATELQEAYGGAAAISANVAQFRTLSALVPEEALLGVHLCFGTLGGWPRFAPDSLDAAVGLANAIVHESPRRVDWMHIPVLDRADDAFFAPLSGLALGGTRPYLGMIHNMAGFAARLATARRYLPAFGVAAFCGFGRMAADDMPRVLDEHRQALAAYRR